MRLDRLGLARYGRFTERQLDFGARPASGPDLHIVYGPNEAGKSTMLAAYLDLLYGIGLQSPYGFLHPYNTMRIEGILELEGVPRVFARIKRAQNSLLDETGQPLADAAILAELGGIARDGYRTMFSLDDATLEAGGESILASRGDLGQLLFSASAGLAALGQRLDAIKAEADQFHRPHGRKTELSDLKARLAALKAEREAIDTLASDYGRLVEAEETAGAAYREATAERGRVQARLEAIGRALGALPLLAQLRGIRAERLPLADLPEPPAGWAAQWPTLQHAEVASSARQATLAEEANRLEDERDGLPVDQAALDFAARVDALDDLSARHRTAEKDLPTRQIELAESRRTIADLLARVGRPGAADPHGLLVGASEAARLTDLAELRSGIEADLAAARAEHAAAGERLAAAEAKDAASAGVVPLSADALARLRATLAAIRADDISGRMARTGHDKERAGAALADALAALAPWSGDADALAHAIVPGAAEIERRRAALAEAEGLARLLAGDADRLATELARQRAEIAVLRQLAGPAAAAEAAAARAAREADWALHRRTLDDASADRFEAAMRRDDSAMAARLGSIADEARLAELVTRHAVTQAEAERAASLSAEAVQRRDTLSSALAAMADRIALGLVDAAGLDGFAQWLGRRERALDLRALAGEAARVHADATAATGEATGRLAAALVDAGATPDPDAGLGDLIETADLALETAALHAADRNARDHIRREAGLRSQALKKAEARESGWQADWQAALDATWLGRAGPLATRAVRDILEALKDLGREIERAAGLSDRIAKMEKDQAVYRAELAAIAEALADPAPGDDAATLATRLRRRIEAARKAESQREDLTGRLAENARLQQALAADIQELRRQIEFMKDHFGVATLAEVGVSLAAVARRATLDREAAETGRSLLLALDVATVAEAEALLDAADGTALAAERAELQRRFEDLDQRCQQLYADLSRAGDRLAAVGGDGAVAAIEARRRTALVEIEDGALRYLRLRAGTIAAETAIRLYRERHRSAMMARASDAFRTISRGAYTGLAAQAEKDGETLIALAAAGGSKAAAELSKGTRFQLYLALRVAGYHEFARTRRAVPFIADDIMESFDDFRAEEAFRLFADMAGTGQVIYLTHHRHLVPIVRSVCPSVRVHHLDPADTP